MIQHILPARSLCLLPKCGVHGEEEDVLGPPVVSLLLLEQMVSHLRLRTIFRRQSPSRSSIIIQSCPNFARAVGDAMAEHMPRVSTGGFLPTMDSNFKKQLKKEAGKGGAKGREMESTAVFEHDAK